MKKNISVLLAALLLLTVFSGCQKAPDGPAINNVGLGEYAIVYSDTDTDYALRAAEYIQKEIKARTGLELPLQEDSAVTAKYEIVVGDTEREVSSKLNVETGANSFALMSHKKQVALEGDYFLIAAAAYYFVETYITEGTFNAQIPKEPTICQPIVEKANNYILLIGDGMGINHTKLYDDPPLTLKREDGFSDGENLFYGYLLPWQGAARTDSLSGLTDSAAAGTALATGYKTYNSSVGLNGDGEPVQNLTELANELGMATAVMSTEARTGATPSAFLAHVADRDDSNGLLENQKIIEQAGTIVNCDFDVYDARQLEKKLEAGLMDTLAQLEQDPDGFFLMYEEAHIDKHSHKNNINTTFMAMARFNQAIGRVMEYAYYHPDTFVLITADHETGDLKPGVDGKLAFHVDTHTNQDVLIFAHGFGSELFAGVTVENTQIAKTFAKMWGVSEFGDPTTDPALE